ncbi:MAG: hypothetical protein ACTHJN_09975 [Ginsengibacter sp.]|jgi:hypothetical protein
MEPNYYTTVVEMPDEKKLDVEYYFLEEKDNSENNNSYLQLLIQLDDCICQMKIEKSITNNINELERIVHNKVINERGHLC